MITPDANHPHEPMRYQINLAFENFILSFPLFFIIIKHIFTKNLRNKEVLVIGRVSSLVEIFIFTVPVKKCIDSLCFWAEPFFMFLC